MYNSPHEILIYNESESRSKTLQLEFDWSMHRRVNVRAAYRWVDAQTNYQDTIPGLIQDPYVSNHRAFTQWSYASKEGVDGDQTRIDATIQWVGPQALPRPSAGFSDHDSYYAKSPAFTQVNIQLSRNIHTGFELYAGIENLLDVKQENPIVGTNYPDDLDNASFDASLVYGPIFGKMSYVGLRWTLGAE
jgi:outer membrane receptor for ferrienterochelin and colicins